MISIGMKNAREMGPSFDPCVNSYSALKACPLLPQQRSDGGEFSLLRTQRPSEIRPKNGSLVGTRLADTNQHARPVSDQCPRQGRIVATLQDHGRVRGGI